MDNADFSSEALISNNGYIYIYHKFNITICDFENEYKYG